jgi:hypothetical protein
LGDFGRYRRLLFQHIPHPCPEICRHQMHDAESCETSPIPDFDLQTR